DVRKRPPDSSLFRHREPGARDDRRTGRSHDSQSRRVNRPGHHRADRMTRQRDKRTRRRGDKGTKRNGDRGIFSEMSPCLLVSLSPCLPISPSLRLYAAFASAASDKLLSAHRYFIAGWLIETLSPLRPLSIEIFDPISRA